MLPLSWIKGIRDMSSPRPLSRLAGRLAVTYLCLAMAPAVARAEVKLDGLFTRNAVLQQGMPVNVFGTAEDGEQVVVTIQNRQAETTAKDGRWQVTLEPLEAGGPYDLRVGGDTAIVVPEIFVGEVWVCAGQANMQWNVFNSRGRATAMIAPENRQLRFHSVEREAAAEPKLSNETEWLTASAATIANFSAVGYYFGRDIQKQRNMPIGLISCCHYLSNAEAWTDRNSIAADPKLKRIIDDVLPDRKDVLTPGALFDGMVAPLSRYTIRGVIWYQGENNVAHADEYLPLFSTLIADWRRSFGKPELPFLFVQIAPYKPLISTSESKWAELREAQLRTWKTVPHTAMVVITDYGSTTSQQPDQKEPVGDRLALAARAVAYDESVEYSGPVYKSFKIIKNTIVVEFDHVGGGLQAGAHATGGGHFAFGGSQAGAAGLAIDG
ncbi:MAG: sialate O-acetylesterase [Pirellulales bacterium]